MANTQPKPSQTLKFLEFLIDCEAENHCDNKPYKIELKQHRSVLNELIVREKELSNLIEILADLLKDTDMSHKIIKSKDSEPDFLTMLKSRLKTKSSDIDKDSWVYKEVTRIWDSKLGDDTKTKDKAKSSSLHIPRANYLGGTPPIMGGSVPDKQKDNSPDSQLPDWLKPAMRKH